LLILVSIFKLLAEISLLALLGQGVLAILAGARREQNLFYQVLQVVTRPLIAGARFITPKVILDRHVPAVAFMLLSFVWLVATITKIDICIQIGVHLCK
jgi:hypothetical protein